MDGGGALGEVAEVGGKQQLLRHRAMGPGGKLLKEVLQGSHAGIRLRLSASGEKGDLLWGTLLRRVGVKGQPRRGQAQEQTRTEAKAVKKAHERLLH